MTCNCYSRMYEMKYKDTRKNGREHVKKENTNIIATYCPICGVKYDEDKDNE